MQNKIVHLLPEDVTVPECKRILNFKPFLEYIKKAKERTNTHKQFFFSYIIEQFELHPNLMVAVSLDEMKNHEPLMELIYNSLSKMVDDEELNYWSLSLPMKPTIFYGTNAFYNLISSIAVNNICPSVSSVGSVRLEGNPVEFVYAVILEKYYGIPSYFSRDIVHALEDKDTGLTRYFQATPDTRFIDILPEKKLPDIKFDIIQSGNYDKSEKLKWIQEKLPLDMFRFEGFGITTLKDVSVKFAVENIRNFTLNHNLNNTDNDFTNVIRWLKIIVENNDIEFGLLPALHVNNKLVFNDGLFANSVLVHAAREVGVEESNYLLMIEKYFNNPKFLFFSEITKEEKEKHEYLSLLASFGIFSYALIPVYFGKDMVGVLEIYSRKKVVLDESLIVRLDPVIPLLSQLLKNGVNEFNEGINKVIKNKFTSIQPSVQWKFNEVAWHYLRDKRLTKSDREIEDIGFKNVYPLYGAIDIRNSTLERNIALNNDLQVQFEILVKMLEKLKTNSGFGLIDEKIFVAKKWQREMHDAETFNQNILVNEFLETNLIPFLLDFKKGNAEASAIMEEYFNAINEENGIAFNRRRLLEKSMSTVISSVNNFLEKMQEDIQVAYPSYFEKFRTDGVEYDIYIGQSIAPGKPFSDIYLKNLRLLQLQSMAAIAKLSAALSGTLPVNVQTTQLIFIHSQPIEIMFRKDEKRFDVEGSYNIRYHVVKKRIDKVLIKDTEERLTQPDKIALVYINQQDANEYIGYIEYLQEKNILNNDLEELELEELQAVNGLKALRVGVVKDPHFLPAEIPLAERYVGK